MKIYDVSLNSYIEECLRQVCREQTHLVFFFSENCAFYEIMCKKMVQPDRPQVTKWYDACTLHAG